MKEMWGCSSGFEVCTLQGSGVHRQETLENSWETWLHLEEWKRNSHLMVDSDQFFEAQESGHHKDTTTDLAMGCTGWKVLEIRESLGWVTMPENSLD